VSRRRLVTLIVGPMLIVGLSLSLTRWVKPRAPIAMQGNDVLAAAGGRGAGVLAHASVTLAAPAHTPSASLVADCEIAARRLAARLGPACATLVHAPLIIAGDMNQTELDRWHRETILPAVRAMQHSYFRGTPDKPVTVLLFTTEESYQHYSRALFDEDGVSVFGYYRSEPRTLVINASTGAGTLVHELTHALLAFDFPGVPDWFNEGLASMHEQCRIRSDGTCIDGLDNWRLPILQQAIRSGRLKPLRSLIRDGDFRGRDEGVHYAQARYFCLYMQRLGVLETFFHQFRANHADDPTGEKTVAAMFPDRTWAELDHELQRWVMARRGS